MKNMILISSPLQAINAVEAIQNFKLSDYEIIIINNEEKVFNSIISILNQFEVFKYSRINFRSFVSLIKYCVKSKFNSPSKPIEKLFIGDFEDIAHLMYATSFLGNQTKVVFIDDGNKTILGYLNNFKITNIRKYVSFNWRLKYKISDFFINRKLMMKNSSIFSIYKVPNEEYKFIKNTMSHLKKKAASSDVCNGIYIIGTPYVELSLIEMEVYAKGIQYIIDKHKNKPVFYIPHRRELMSKFYDLKISENFKWIENKTTIELFFINEQIYPEFVYGFGSSALFTIKQLFDKSEILNMSFKLADNPSIKYSKKHRASIESEYKALEDYYTFFGIKKISLNNLIE